MKLPRFDRARFHTDVLIALRTRGRGSHRKMVKDGAVAATTLRSLLLGQTVRDIDVILRVCAYLELNLNDYARTT